MQLIFITSNMIFLTYFLKLVFFISLIWRVLVWFPDKFKFYTIYFVYSCIDFSPVLCYNNVILYISYTTFCNTVDYIHFCLSQPGTSYQTNGNSKTDLVILHPKYFLQKQDRICKWIVLKYVMKDLYIIHVCHWEIYCCMCP